MKNKIFLVLSLFFVFPLFSFGQSPLDYLKPEFGRKIGVCSICNMDVFEKMMTRVEILADDTVYHACGIGCASAIMEGKNVKDVKVVDFKNLKLIDAKKAWFVTGSVVLPARAMLPEFSFSSKEDAEKFSKLYGGYVFDYQGMLNVAKKIREERKKN